MVKILKRNYTNFIFSSDWIEETVRENYIFLAYFHTLLSALFRSSVRPSVTATSLQGIDQFCSFMAQSIAYESGTCLKEGIFFESVLELVGGVRSSVLFFVFLECVDQMCGSNVWIKCVDQMCGSNVWIKCVDQMCGSNVWINCSDQIYGSIVWINCTDYK
jgi:hypothetical protein